MQGKVGSEERLEAGLEEIMIQITHNRGIIPMKKMNY